MYIGHGRLCVCLSLAAFPLHCTDPDVTLVPSSCALLGGFAIDFVVMTTAPNAKCQQVLVLDLCLV